MAYIHRRLLWLISIIIIITSIGIIRLTILEILKIPSLTFSSLLSPFKNLSGYGALKDENDKLKSTINLLANQIASLKEEAAENERLRHLLNFKKTNPYNLVAARIIGRSPSIKESVILIDKGSDNGLTQDMPVITPDGLVGRIDKIGRSISWVILLTDPAFRASCITSRSREPGLLQGRGDTVCLMRYLSDDADIIAGDEIITSGSGGVFPKGLRTGRVISVHNNDGQLFKEALVKPAVALRLIEEVLIITDRL